MTVTVTVDDREPAAVVRALEAHADVDAVRVTRLDAGDIVVGTAGFERKTPRDYVSSMMGRSGVDLRDQLARLRASVEHAYLLLEGDLSSLDALPTGVSPAAIRGSLASVLVREQVPVVPCSDRERLVDLAVRVGRKHGEEPGSRPLPTGAVAGRSEPLAKRMYGCIEGIGPELAGRLYDRYPSVEALLAATPADLTDVDGVGEVRARRVYDALRGE